MNENHYQMTLPGSVLPDLWPSEVAGAATDRRVMSDEALLASRYMHVSSSRRARADARRAERPVREGFATFAAWQTEQWAVSTLRAHRPVAVSAYGPARFLRSLAPVTCPTTLAGADVMRQAESAADAFLLAADGHTDRVDVLVETTSQAKLTRYFRKTPAADAVAYRGVRRYRPMTHRHHSTPILVAQIDAYGYGRIVTAYRTDAVTGGWSWVGFDRCELKPRGARKRRVKVLAAQGIKRNRGNQPQTAWTVSTRSLANRWAKAGADIRATATAIEAVLRTSSTEHVLDVTTEAHGTVRVDVPAALVTLPNGSAMPVREYARRSALAGATMA